MDSAQILSNSLSQSRSTLLQQMGKEGKDLNALHRKAKNLTDATNTDEISKSKKHKELKDVAKQYEALFFQQLMSAMDKTIDRSNSMLSGGNTESMFRDMLNQEMASSAANRPGGQGLGIAEAIYQQMSMVLEGKVNPPSSGNIPPEAVQITGQLNKTNLTTQFNDLQHNTEKTSTEKTQNRTETTDNHPDKKSATKNKSLQKAYLPQDLSTIYQAEPSKPNTNKTL